MEQETVIFVVFDIVAKQKIAQYSSRYWAEKCKEQIVRERNLQDDDVVIIEVEL